MNIYEYVENLKPGYYLDINTFIKAKKILELKYIPKVKPYIQNNNLNKPSNIFYLKPKKNINDKKKCNLIEKKFNLNYYKKDSLKSVKIKNNIDNDDYKFYMNLC